MSNLVVDEWLWSDLCGDNSEKHQKEALDFLRAVYKKCDKIVTVKGSSFVQKYWDLCKHAHRNDYHSIVKYISANFWYNSKKAELLEESSLVPIPDSMAGLVNPDDHYLIQALLSSEAQTIVTTDVPLRDTLVENKLGCILRDEFIPDYILKNG
jgi:predicted nucleic acid-binding protein